MQKTNYMLKGLGYAYILTLVALLIYNAVLTFTSVSGNTIAIMSSVITTASAALGGFYTSKNVNEKGLIYGLGVGFMYIVCLILVVFLAKDDFMWGMDLVYKAIVVSLAGGVGGVLGVNFK